MMDTRSLFERIAETGALVRVDPVGYTVYVPQASRLGPELLMEAKAHKAELVERISRYGVELDGFFYAWDARHFGEDS
jgi:hypothetical protein